jgi:hypothetical protein
MEDSRPENPEISFSREKGALETTAQDNRRAELLALFRLLVREPPKDHDFRACPICKRYGITRI